MVTAVQVPLRPVPLAEAAVGRTPLLRITHLPILHPTHHRRPTMDVAPLEGL